MILDIAKPMQTNMGEPARYLGTLDSGEIVAAVKLPGAPHEAALLFNRFGVWTDGVRWLVNTPERHVRWVNVYPLGRLTSAAHTTRLSADRKAQPDRIACIRIEFEEGEGLGDE